MAQSLKKRKKELVNRELVRPERNIESWPIFSTSNAPQKSRILERQEGTEKVIIGKVKNDQGEDVEVGILRTFDLKCFYALVRLWEVEGKLHEKPVSFSLHEIAEILKRSWSGRTHQEIKSSLLRLKEIPIRWVKSFYDEEAEEKLTTSFNLLDELSIWERLAGNERKVSFSFSHFQFEKHILHNLMQNRSKPLNLKQILALNRELSILIYRWIDLIMADKTYFERKSEGIINEELQLEGKRYKYPSRRKQVLEPALEELKGAKLSTGILTEARMERTKDESDWKAVFIKQGEKEQKKIPSKSEVEVTALTKEMVSALGDENSKDFYRKVAKRCPSDMIHRLLSEAKYEDHEGRVNKSKGAWFTYNLKKKCEEYGIDLQLNHS